MQDDGFTFEVVGGVPVVTAPGEIDMSNGPLLRSALRKAAAHGPGTIVADLSRTIFCASSGLHALLTAHQSAQAEGGGLLLVLHSTAVLRVFTLTGIDRMIPHCASLADALAQASGNGRRRHRRADEGAEDRAPDSSDFVAEPHASGLTAKPADRPA